MSRNIIARVAQKLRLSRLSLMVILCGSLTAFVFTAQTAYAGPGTRPTSTSWQGCVGEPTLSYGSTGAWVKTLQQSLNLAYQDHADPFANTPYDFKPLLVQNGIFGLETKNAVLDYQIAHHLKADGIVGPQMWNSLGVCEAR